MLLTTLVGGQSFDYLLPGGSLPGGPFVHVQANGNMVAELIAAIKTSNAGNNSSLLLGQLPGTSGGVGVNNGSIPVTGGNAQSATPNPYTDLDVNATIGPQTGVNTFDFSQINLRGIASNSGGVTYAFNIFNTVTGGNGTLNFPTTSGTTTSNNTLWDIQLLQINNTSGKATFIADLTNQLETGQAGYSDPNDQFGLPKAASPLGAAMLPDLLGASNVTIGGAAFNPIDGRLYFDVEFTPPSNNTVGTGSNLTQDILMSIDPSAATGANPEIPVLNTLTYANLVNAANTTAENSSRLDNSGGTQAITALTFQSINNSNALLWTYRVPSNNTAGARTNLESYNVPLTFNAVTGRLINNGFNNVLINGNNIPVTGLSYIPPSSGVAAAQNGNFLFATVTANGTTSANLGLTGGQLLRIDLSSFTPTVWGPTQDLNRPGGIINNNIVGDNLQGLTWNPTQTDPVTHTTGVLMSYDASTHDVVYVNNQVRGTQLYAVYTNQADINSSLTFQVYTVDSKGNQISSLYTGAFAADSAWSRNVAVGTDHIPGNIGQALLGYFDGTSTAPDDLGLTATLVGNVGIMPSSYTTDLSGIPSTSLNPGLYVGYGLETPVASSGSIIGDVLGSGFSNVQALAIRNDGLFAAVNSVPGSGDTLAFIDGTTGQVSAGPYTVVDSSNNALAGIEGLAFGDVNLNGSQQLYAVYDLHNGQGPILGTLSVNGTNAVFYQLGVLGLSGATVQAIAFSNHQTSYDANHQGLYLIATGGAAGVHSTLFQVDPTTGTIVATIGEVVSTASGQPTPLQVKSAAFDASGNLIAFDSLTGRLQDVALTPTVILGVSYAIAGQVVSTAVGSVNPTVGAFARDPVDGQFYVIDNETDDVGSTPSSILMKIKDYTNPLNQDVSLGKFLFDGTVTGRVFISGSIDTFYAGWIITGTSDGSTSITDNFHVNGDIHHLLSLASIGTDGTIVTNGLPTFVTGTQIYIGGKLGDYVTDGMSAAQIIAVNGRGIPNNTGDQTEEQQYVLLTGNAIVNDGLVINAWANGSLVQNTGNFAPFQNNNFNNAQFLGSTRSTVTGQPDVITLDGQMWQTDYKGTYPGPDAVDYFALSLLAGQAITVQLNALFTAHLGIYDPDGNLIATDYDLVDPTAVWNRPISFTATKAGAYRIAIAAIGDTNFNGVVDGGETVGGYPSPSSYTLTVQNAGDLAIGGVSAGSNLILNLAGSNPNSALTGGIEAGSGDIGGVTAGQAHPGAGHSILAPITSFSVVGTQSIINGYSGGTPNKDIAADTGNLRDVVAGSIGYAGTATSALTSGGFASAPDIYVPQGSVGLIQTLVDNGVTDTLSVLFAVPAGANIQHVSAVNWLGGVYRADKAIGVINAYDMPFGSAETEFHANADSKGSDGVIDLIDVTLNMGAVGYGGPAIETGPGGDVRFIHVGGNLIPDVAFGSAGATFAGETTLGWALNSPGAVKFTDDSGATVYLTPGMTVNPNAGVVDTTTGVAQPATVIGQLATRVYGVRGSGGVVIVDVQTNAGLTVNATSNGVARPAEVTDIHYGGVGIALGVNTITGAPTVPTDPYANSFTVPPVASHTPVFSRITFTGGRTDVFDIDNVFPTGLFPAQATGVFPADSSANSTYNTTTGTVTYTIAPGTIDAITNNTGGDIFNAFLGDVGSLTVSGGNVGGNVGSTYTSTGQLLVGTVDTQHTPNTYFGTYTTVSSANVLTVNGTPAPFPFNNQRNGLSLGNVATISTGKSVGNITTSGAVGTITTNTLGNTNPNLFYGVNGPIVVNGSNALSNVTNPATGNVTASPTIPAGLTSAPPVSLVQVNVGNGILFSGTGDGSQAGIYAVQRITTITGSNGAVIRGNVVSDASIGSINITNGSIIHSRILDVDTFAMSGEFATNPTIINQSGTATNPFFDIGSISLPGNGGILSSEILGANIGNVLAGGFGILQSFFETTHGTIATVTAGGYGLRADDFESDELRGLITTGTGATAPFTSFSRSALPSVFGSFGFGSDPFGLSPVTDISRFINGDVQQNATYSGLTTGAIELVNAIGSGNLTQISGYQLVNDNIGFANSIGSISVGRGGFDPVGLGGTNPSPTLTDINNTIAAGKLTSLTVNGNVQGLDLQIAGPTGTINIGGSFLTTASIAVKGPQGDLKTFNVNGAFAGNLTVAGVANSITIGTPTARVGTDDFSGNITILQDHSAANALNLLTLYGSISNGTLDIAGNVGTINVFRSLSGLTSNLDIHGNLGNLIVGSDLAHYTYSLVGNLAVEGNLGNATINGALNGLLLVKGNANVTVISKAGGTIVSTAGGVEAEGVISSFTSSGGIVAGNIIGTKGVSKATITGNFNGRLSSTEGNVGTVVISGNLNGFLTTPYGTINSLTLHGALNGTLQANSLNNLNIPGNVAGTINVTNGVNAITIGSALLTTGVIQAGWLSAISISGNELGNITVGQGAGSPVVLTVGGNLGGKVFFSTPVSASIAHDITAAGSLTTTSSLTGLKVSGAVRGNVEIDGQIGTISAAAIAGGVITGGFGINSIAVSGSITNSIIQSGIARGDDHVLGTNDVNETPSMADIGSITAGNVQNSIIAAGGNIGSLKTGTMTYSSASSGLVLASAQIAAASNDSSPLATVAELNAARSGSTLLHGNFNSAVIGGAGLVNSALTAGVSPGADGAFDYTRNPNSDDNINSSITGGASSFGSVSAAVNGGSVVLAATGGGTGTTAHILRYTLDSNSATSITPNDPVTGSPIATASVGTPATFSINGQTITVTITGGAGATVSMYDNPATTNILDTLVINGGSTGSPVNVTVTTTGVGVLDLGRVLATDGTNVNSFSFNGYLVGDGQNGPQLWINSNMQTFSVGGFSTNGAIASQNWSGVIGGNVTNLFIGTQGTGKLRIGGTVTTATIGNSVGDPNVLVLGHVNAAQAGSPSTIALDPTTNITYAYSSGFIFPINVNTGAVTPKPQLHTAFTNQTLAISGMDFSANGTLYGVASLYNQEPTETVGSTLSGGDQLHGMAVDPVSGDIFAVNTNIATNLDQLVTLDPTSGAMTVIGTLQDVFQHTFDAQFLALAFDSGGGLYGLIKTTDTSTSTANAVAMVRINTTATNGIVTISAPSTSANAYPPVFIKLSNADVTDTYNALAFDPASSAGAPAFFAVRHVSGADILDHLTIASANLPSATTVTAATVGTILAGGNNTTIIGMGYDENNHLIGLDQNGTTGDLVGIKTTAGTVGSSIYISNPGTIPNSLAGFAFSPTGTNFQTFAYSTNSVSGGTLYVNPGNVATLGTIAPNTGTFTLVRALSQDALGTPLAGNVTSAAVTKSGTTNIFAVTDKGVLAEYDASGNLVGNEPLGTVVDSLTGRQLAITALAFDNGGHLIGLDSTLNRLVVINPTTVSATINGITGDVVLGSQLTPPGSVNAAKIVSIEYSALAGVFVGFNAADSEFDAILGTTYSALGGITANYISTLNILGSSYGGNIHTTGIAGGAGFGSIVANGGGSFTGAISTPGYINSFTRTGNFNGTLVASGYVSSILINGNLGDGGVISVGGNVNSLVILGSISGTVLIGNAGTVTLGSVVQNGIVQVSRATNSVDIASAVAGRVSLNSVNSFRVSGLVQATGIIRTAGNAGSVTLVSGNDVGSSILFGGNVTSLAVGGNSSGVVAVRGSVNSVSFNNVINGVFTAGGDINTLTVVGMVARSVLSSGVWVGADGLYNTSDDVIYGGSINSARINGDFNNSAIVAGALPRLGASSGTNNIPDSNTAYIGNSNAANIQDVDSAEAGGIAVSRIGSIVFAGGVNQVGGSVVVAADSISGVAATPYLNQRVLNNPTGQLAVIGITRINNGEIDVGFNKPIDTGSITDANFIITDSSGNALSGITFSYYIQTLGNGVTQGVVQIFRDVAFPSPTIVTINGVTDRVGPRSALQDFNQDGVVTGNPFAPALVPATYTL